MTAHPLDHLVLPVADLDAAQKRYRALGFTVAPLGIHPFGTANCCVFLQDGTFLEPLVVADPELAELAVEEGNAFVQGDQDFRKRSGDEGFSALVLQTSDANEDHAQFMARGISGGSMLDFSRPVVDKTGKTGTASFRLAFAKDERSQAPFFFTCERLKTPKIDRAALQHHRNAVTGLRRILLVARDPHAHRSFLEQFCGVEASAEHGGASLAIRLPNAEILVHSPLELESRWGVAIPGFTTEGLQLVAAVFAVPNIPALASLFNADSIAYLALDNALVATPAPGQGTHFIFEASE